MSSMSSMSSMSTISSTSWSDLSIETRCEIIKRMPAETRLMLWMMYDTLWDGLFSDATKHNPEYIARIWTARDPLLERRMEALCGQTAMNEAAALRGYRSWLERPGGGGAWLQAAGPVEAADIAYWMAIGGHVELLRDYIATGTPGCNIELTKKLWTAAALNDDAVIFAKLLEWHMMPVDVAEAADTFFILGKYAARNVIEHCILVLFMAGAGAEEAQEDYNLVVSGPWVKAVLMGCMSAPEPRYAEARVVFTRLVSTIHLPVETIYDLLETAITLESVESIMYVRFWLEEVAYAHSAVLSYVAHRAIETNDRVLLTYIVNGAAWGEWELAEPMLWHACQVGTAELVAYLLDNGVPRSSQAYQHCMLGPLARDSNETRLILITLVDHDVPVEDMYGSALAYAVEANMPCRVIEQFIEAGCAVTFKVIAAAWALEVFNMLLGHIPEDRHAEYKDYLFYDALSADNTERVMHLFDNLHWQVPPNFYYRCCMLGATRTFMTAWLHERFVGRAAGEGGQGDGASGLELLEEGIAHHDCLIDYVWRHPHVMVNWRHVLLTAMDQQKDASVGMLMRLMGGGSGSEWRCMYDSVLEELPCYAHVPFQGFE